MTKKTKLELTWIGKAERPRLEPRILLEDPALSHHAGQRVSDGDIFDNRLIFGDNLLALKALEQEFSGRIRCIYIDPPFNTGQAFAHYDDGIEHSLWLSLMRNRLELLRRLLAPNGSMFVQCDDNEQAYCKVMMDELFGRENFITTFIWQKVDSPNDNKVPVTPDHEYILCYSRNPDSANFKQKVDENVLVAFRTRDAIGRLYRDRLLKKNGKSSLRADRPSMYFPIPDPDGNQVFPVHDDGREARWAVGKEMVFRLLAAEELVWKNRGTISSPKWVPYTREYAPDVPMRPYPTIWTDVMTSRQSKAHQRQLLPAEQPFDTPKPEQLLRRVIELATDPGDWVLDSFGGSGTTGAVAHKTGRKWIMVELGQHCHTHVIPRMLQVINGTDRGGITSDVDWLGGGGFRYFRLASSLLEKDRYGNWIVSKQYNPSMLAEAVCKHEGFRYAPSDTVYWQHGQSTERDFIYVTTQTLGREQLAQLSEEVGPDRSLLVCCAAYRAGPNEFPNLTIKKIPHAVLHRCEWGRDDYSLAVSQLPGPPVADGGDGDGAGVPTGRAPVKKRGRKAVVQEPALFEEDES